MRYPTLSPQSIEPIVSQLLADEDVDFTAHVKWVGEGAELSLSLLEALGETVRAQIAQFADEDRPPKGDEYEGQTAPLVHLALRDVPLPILDDPGFWRYVSLVHLWPLIRWREPGPFEKNDVAAYSVYIDGRKNTECVPLRMFLRAQIALEGDDDYTLSSAVPEATDFWRSHIIRVRTGYSPTLAKAFVTLQRDHRMTTDPLRAYAKKVNRVSSNVVLHLYGETEASGLLDELYDD